MNAEATPTRSVAAAERDFAGGKNLPTAAGPTGWSCRDVDRRVDVAGRPLEAAQWHASAERALEPDVPATGIEPQSLPSRRLAVDGTCEKDAARCRHRDVGRKAAVTRHGKSALGHIKAGQDNVPVQSDATARDDI